jgi:hypothetical protein
MKITISEKKVRGKNKRASVADPDALPKGDFLLCGRTLNLFLEE